MSRAISFLQGDSWPEWAQFCFPTAWLVILLLAAAALRLYGINNLSPPGLEHDEVANWLIDRAILDGDLAVYYTQAYGHEAGFHYLQAASVALLGDHALALRLPAVFAGILLVAVHYALTKRLFGLTTALLSAALLALLFWPVFYSRLGLRAIMLPVIAGISIYAWWKAWPPRGGQESARSAVWFSLAGLFAGLSLYTYMAARAVPIFYALFIIYLLLFHYAQAQSRWRGMLLFWIVFALISLPLFLFLQTNPGAEFRISEVDAPLRALLAGDARLVVANALKIAGMFAFRGDPLWRQNVAGAPVFDPLLALFFYAGLFLALLRLKDARYAFLLIWLAVSAVPSLVTSDAPSSIRMINALLVVTIFPILTINVLAALSTLLPWFSAKLAYLLFFLILLAYVGRTARDIFITWPQNEEVRFVWQEALTDIARYLDDSAGDSPVAIGGWSPATLDAPTMALSMQRRDLQTRHFGSDSVVDPISTVILPGWGDALSLPPPAELPAVRLVRPDIRDLSPGIEQQLAQWGGVPQKIDFFVLYEPSSVNELPDHLPPDGTFADQLQLIGYRLPENLAGCAADFCTMLTYWRVLAPQTGPRRFFLHALNENNDLLAQHDALDAPARWWEMGDLLVQEHRLPPLGESAVSLLLGVYDPQTGRRLLLADERDAYRLPPP